MFCYTMKRKLCESGNLLLLLSLLLLLFFMYLCIYSFIISIIIIIISIIIFPHFWQLKTSKISSFSKF
jgi:hypothetical protein